MPHTTEATHNNATATGNFADAATLALSARQKGILRGILSRGFMPLDALAEHFSCSTQTIRRDVRALAAQGLIRRYHGGAGPASGSHNAAYGVRRELCAPQKRRIARLVASRIPDHASVVLDIGTTSEFIAEALAGHTGLRIITNNLNVAALMRGARDVDILVAGGRLRQRDNGIIGESAVEFFKQFRPDYGVVTLSGIDTDGTLLDFDEREIRITRCIMRTCRRAFLAADKSKFGRGAMMRLGHISDVDALFTDGAPPGRFREILSQAGVCLHVAAAGDEDAPGPDKRGHND
ncbi:DeoR/GlpR family DNA-binding transcription regulator [Desulfobaculum sp. SPO524]|uniref:DeoR/GlpR family DNA-binding transcription regulator n=1 Tax=Desulfobaculum sp. SPO524 TaxID=3378071 RepID=UPI0038524A1D